MLLLNELELDWPLVIATPVSSAQLHLYKEPTIRLLGTNRHDRAVVIRPPTLSIDILLLKHEKLFKITI